MRKPKEHIISDASGSIIKASNLANKIAIIFDMDGVVIDSEALHERASRVAFAAQGIEVPESLFGDFKGRTDRAVVEHVMNQYRRPKERVDEVLELKRQSYASFIDELLPVQGVLDCLEQVAATHRLALTTSASHRNQELAFRKFNLHPFFEVVVTSNDITKPKPDPQPYLVTVEKLALEPADCIVIEDSTHGVRSATGAGCFVVGITTSFDEVSLKAAGAHLVVHSYEQFLEMMG